MILFSFLKHLWPFGRKRARPAPPPPVEPVAPLPQPEPAPPPAAVEAPAPPAERDVEAAEQAASEPSAAILEPEPEPAAPPAGEAGLEPGPVEAWEEDDTRLDEEEPLEDPDEKDPFVTGRTVSQDLGPLAERRAAARALALAGENRIYLSDAAGPGSLAEALAALLQEGKVAAEFHEGGPEGPHLLYRPLN